MNKTNAINGLIHISFPNCCLLHRSMYIAFFYLLHMLVGSGTCVAQQHAISWHGSVVDAVCSRLSKTYIYPEQANQICALLKANLATGKYTSINDPLTFANRLTADLQSINNDKHLSLYYAPAEVVRLKVKQSDTAGSRKMQADLLAAIREWNFGFRSTRIMDGNIGYLNLMAFTEFVTEATGTLAASMQFLQNTDAIIIDLRKNPGGSPHMVAMVASFFLDSGIHLNSIYSRVTNDTVKTFTQANINGKRRTKVPLYLLVGKNTASAAEEFSYDMKHLNRATLVGNTTRGGANPARDFPVGDSFIINVPFGKGINPVTGTNWSGVGVQPHIPCAETDALLVAHTAALNDLRAKATHPDIKESLSFYIQVNRFALEGNKLYGYEPSGDTIQFTFNPKDYHLPFKNIKSVAVVSHFSEWNPGSKRGIMQKAGSAYLLAVPKDNIGRDDYIPFQFVVNGTYRVIPPYGAKNKLLAGADGQEPYLYVLNKE